MTDSPTNPTLIYTVYGNGGVLPTPTTVASYKDARTTDRSRVVALARAAGVHHITVVSDADLEMIRRMQAEGRPPLPGASVPPES